MVEVGRGGLALDGVDVDDGPEEGVTAVTVSVAVAI